MNSKDIIIATAVLLLSSLSSIAAQQVDPPDYLKALGLKSNVKSIGVFTEEEEADMYDYCTYKFDNLGRLISYREAEMVEAAYYWTAFFDNDGLPTYLETVFIDYWTEPDDDGNPPVTTTCYTIRREQNGSVVMLFIGDDEEGGEKQVKVTRDDNGRIIEVDNLSMGEVHRYRYSDTTNVPCYYDGSLAFPQVDMLGGHRINFPSQQNIPDESTTFQYGIWQFEVQYRDDNE